MKNICLTLLAIALYSCGNPPSEEEKKEKLPEITSDSTQNEETTEESFEAINIPASPSTDSLIQDYLDKNKEKFLAGEEDRLSYITDITERDGRDYVSVQIGVSDEFRFSTMQWLYIDTMTHNIYELDIAEDTLLLWK